jgi:DNA-binding NtrC family response regulator
MTAKLSVLVVDDEALIRWAVAETLNQAGHEVAAFYFHARLLLARIGGADFDFDFFRGPLANHQIICFS